MDTDTLERLMIDRALGGLPPDAEVLLSAYLADHPDARAIAERIEETVTSAKAALADDRPAWMPPFPAETIRRGFSARRRWVFIARAAGLAACVLIGVGLHLAWTSGGVGDTTGAPPSGIRERAPFVLNRQAAAAEPQGPGFWSARRWYERTEQRRLDSGRRVIWDSPLSLPRLGDAT